MVWVFASVVLVLLVLDERFRKVMLKSAAWIGAALLIMIVAIVLYNFRSPAPAKSFDPNFDPDKHLDEKK